MADIKQSLLSWLDEVLSHGPAVLLHKEEEGGRVTKVTLDTSTLPQELAQPTALPEWVKQRVIKVQHEKFGLIGDALAWLGHERMTQLATLVHPKQTSQAGVPNAGVEVARVKQPQMTTPKQKKKTTRQAQNALAQHTSQNNSAQPMSPPPQQTPSPSAGQSKLQDSHKTNQQPNQLEQIEKEIQPSQTSEPARVLVEPHHKLEPQHKSEVALHQKENLETMSGSALAKIRHADATKPSARVGG